MNPSRAHPHDTDDNASPRFTLLIRIEVDECHRPAIASRLDDYLQQMGRLFQPQSGYLGAELQNGAGPQLVGLLNWRRREDWESAWDCQRTRSDVFADSLLRLGARSIRFDSQGA